MNWGKVNSFPYEKTHDINCYFGLVYSIGG